MIEHHHAFDLLHLQKAKFHKTKLLGFKVCLKIQNQNTFDILHLPKTKAHKNKTLGLQNIRRQLNINTHLMSYTSKKTKTHKACNST